jgi:FlaA1/EpsC-like NDP-sugar epimerase
MPDSPARFAAFRARMRWAIVYAIETATILASAVLAFLLRFDFHIPGPYVPALFLAIGIWLPVKLCLFRILGLDRRSARYVSLADLVRFACSNAIGSSVSSLILLAVGRGAVPRSVYIIDFLLCLMFTVFLRAGVRMASETRNAPRPGSNRKRTIVYGAGSAAASLLRDLRQDPAVKYDVCGLVDDDRQKHGLFLQDVKILGGGCDLSDLARKHAAEFVLIAIPSASGPQMKVIIDRCNAAEIPYKTIPGLAEIINEDGLARQIRDVAVEDLLGRTPVNLEHDRISARLRGQTVLVTGAAGSIGSEICRQVARFRPAAIIGYEIAESPLFNLGLAMERDFPGCAFHQEIGDIRNSARLEEVFDRHRPGIVYHAAAYKHVPLMESHVFEAVENNVFGTLNVVQAARDFGVSEFVMISSDKAVRPASVMGATKRLAELLVRSLQPEGRRYVSVRFGNVLGSNGSVVPIFKEQIARGGPVTVTDPEMRRYFMTIPEACQLVLQASTMGKGAEIFVLDMGEPVRIVDLARNLILLSGFRPDHDIQIEFTGRRPGEKLFEELNEMAEGLVPTHHEKILIYEGAAEAWAEVGRRVNRLRDCCTRRDADELFYGLAEAVPEYQPGEALARQSQTAG